MTNKFNYVNESEKFWNHSFRVWLSEYHEVIVNANHEGDALDYAIDYATSQEWVCYGDGLFLTPEQVEELEQEGTIDDYWQGGNESKYLNSFNVRIEKLD